MRFFSTFLLLFLFLFSFWQQVKCQNLIYDWSVEEYETCPYGVALTLFVPHWLSFSNSPDYFNFCSSNMSPILNSAGWQYPKSGDGMIGAVTFHAGISNAREHFGVQLEAPLQIGQAYDISFHVVAAINPGVTGLATNNLGMLLMTEDYLTYTDSTPFPIGPFANYAHLNVDTFVTDTANWTMVSTSITADSAYQYVAFGNFFDDDNTMVTSLDSISLEPATYAYYFFDDFCIVESGGECFSVLTTRSIESKEILEVYPNPVSDHFTVRSNSAIVHIRLLSIDGTWINEVQFDQNLQIDEYAIQIFNQRPGVYIVEIATEEGITRRKIVIQP